MKWAYFIQRGACVVAVLLAALVSSFAAAAPVVSFSSPDDLNNLIVGQSVTVRVNLANLASGDELQYLAATVNFDGAALGIPTSIDDGAILPSPLNDPLDFVTASAYGLADGNFLTAGTTSASHITSNGTFYTFHLIAQAPATGQIAFNFVDALQFNPANPSQPLQTGITAGAALPFSVTVPEPALGGMVPLALALLHRRRKPDPVTAAVIE